MLSRKVTVPKIDTLHTLLKLPDTLQIGAFTQQEAEITLQVRSCAEQGTCPGCNHLSSPLHSHYHRIVWVVIFAEGFKPHTIAKQLGISEREVRKYFHMTYLPPKRCPRNGPSLIDPYRDLLHDDIQQRAITLEKHFV